LDRGASTFGTVYNQLADFYYVDPSSVKPGVLFCLQETQKVFAQRLKDAFD
jgi:hypothetical protein